MLKGALEKIKNLNLDENIRRLLSINIPNTERLIKGEKDNINYVKEVVNELEIDSTYIYKGKDCVYYRYKALNDSYLYNFKVNDGNIIGKNRN